MFHTYHYCNLKVLKRKFELKTNLQVVVAGEFPVVVAARSEEVEFQEVVEMEQFHVKMEEEVVRYQEDLGVN